MARRSPETLADYLVVAVSPALIMLLVGSLVFFLIEVFYQGQYQGRLLFVMAMFVMAIVCVARISMEEGAGYAALFGLPLAIVTAIALARFVEIRGALASVGPLFNLGLMALIWWSAHKLTWDCTLIDDAQDASGHGLLQELGFDRPAGANGAAPSGPAGTSAPAAPEATTAQALPQPLPWWQRMFEADRRPHAPGLWVVYFSLAALPLFGVGGWFIPSTAADVRQRAFLFLVVYVAAGLTLLLATSFLGLRRYLRQRRLEMPLEMAATWVGVGLVMVVATLLICALVPRPDSVWALARLPIEITSPEHKANRIAAGPEGAEEDPNRPSSSTAEAQDNQKSQRKGSGKQQEQSSDSSQKSSSQQDSSQQNGSSQDKSGKSGNSQSGDQSSSNSQQSSSNGKSGEKGKSAGEQQSDSQNDAADKSQQPNQSQKGQGAKGQKGDKSQGERSSKLPDHSNQPDKTQQASDSKPQSSQAAPTNEPPPARSRPNVKVAWGEGFWWLLRAAFFLALAIAAAVVVWLYREQLLAAWRKLLSELRELFARWFGSKAPVADPAAAASAAAAPPRPFADFSDPFASGAAKRMSWADLVRYTYQALEAWARERGCPRASGQTPHEFALALGQAHPSLGRLAAALVDWYGQLAYSSRPAPGGATDPLRQLWNAMRSSQAAA
jgi:hypothetical protein